MPLHRTSLSAALALPATPTSSRHERLNSLSTRIILFVFLATFFTASLVSWLAVGAVWHDTEVRVEHRNQVLLAERGRELEDWAAEAAREVEAASAPGTSWFIEILDVLPDEQNTALLPVPPALADFVDRIELRSAAAPSRVETEAALAACLPLRTELREIGAGTFLLEACLAESRLASILLPPLGEFRGSRLLVVDGAGRVIGGAGVRSSARIGQTVPFASSQASLSPTKMGLVTYSGTMGSKQATPTSLVGSGRPVAGGHWTLLVESSRSHAFAPAAAVLKQVLVVDICIVLLFTVLAYKITGAIMRPINALSEGAQRIARGQVDYQIPLPSKNQDELGLLIRTFNDMMARLRSNQIEIEQDRIRLGEKNDELQHANEILSQLSITDGLTKLHNHRYFQDHLTREIKRVSRTAAPLSLVLIDIDDFKQLNDTYGHAAGDEVLMSLASIMNDSARESDLIARYGGEEFVILMPNTDLPGAVHLAEKVRMAVESTRLIIGDTLRPVDITISVGVAVFEGDRREFFAEADRALYQAKAAGKNCVVIANRSESDSREGEPGSDDPSPVAAGI